jgi:TRAP-type mannitol/chloroaromatic compound transport system permease small subunit
MVAGSEYIPKFSKALDRTIQRIGETTAWLNGALIVVIISQVILRYVFERGLVVLEELQWHLYAIGIMIGLSYCVIRDTHIRLDLFHSRFSRRRKAKIELLGIVFLLMPMIIIILLHSWPFVAEAFRVSERSDSPVGLPYRWVVKAFIPIGFGLLGLAGLSRLFRAITLLTNGSR